MSVAQPSTTNPKASGVALTVMLSSLLYFKTTPVCCGNSTVFWILEPCKCIFYPQNTERLLALGGLVYTGYTCIYIMKVSLTTHIETGHCSVMHNWASQHCGELSLLESVSEGCKE